MRRSKKILNFLSVLLFISSIFSCEYVGNWYAKNQEKAREKQENIIVLEKDKARAIKELELLQPYGMVYNPIREKLGLLPIPISDVDAIVPRKGADNAYLKWKNTIPRGKYKRYWSHKKIYYDNRKRLIESDFFYGKKVYKIFNEAKLDIYADNCIELNNCDDPPTIMVNEKLLAIYCHTDSSWQIKYTTVNSKKPVTDFEGREKTTLLSQSEMNQLLTSWGLYY
jgi:hypothetical protein